MTQQSKQPTQPETDPKVHHVLLPELLQRLGIDESMSINDLIQHTEGKYLFDEEDDHRMGIRTFNVYDVSNNRKVFFLTVAEGYDEDEI